VADWYEGMSFLLNPFAFAAAGGDFESIATVTVGSGGAASIEFTSIPATFAHLQIRMINRVDDTSFVTGMTFNNVGGTSYANHLLYGTGSSATAEAATSGASFVAITTSISTNGADQFAANVIDILDYASTTKNTTARSLIGRDHNGSGLVGIASGLFNNTAAVSSIKITPSTGNFVEHSTAALYGIKA
jgi:dihydroorotate dehydrogenase